MGDKDLKGTILYIEDEIEALRTMLEFFNLRGFNVITAFTAEEGYDRLKEYKPDLIVIDLKLIGESGIDFIERIQHADNQTPIMVITAYPEKIREITSRKLKIYAYFTKPFSYADLYKTVKQILEVR